MVEYEDSQGDEEHSLDESGMNIQSGHESSLYLVCGTYLGHVLIRVAASDIGLEAHRVFSASIATYELTQASLAHAALPENGTFDGEHKDEP